MRQTKLRMVSILLAALGVCALGRAQQEDAARKAARKLSKEQTFPGQPIEPTASLNTPGAQEDYPAICATPDGGVWAAYVAWDGTADTLRLAEWTAQGLADRGALSGPGNVYHPGLARAGDGTIWCVWTEMEGPRWRLIARPIAGGKPAGSAVPIGDPSGNEVFPDVQADRQGRVWAAWEALDGGCPDIYAAFYDPAEKKWSKPIRVTTDPAGDWEPRLASGARGEALIVFDTYARGNYDVCLARVSPDGKTTLLPLAASDRYEGRPAAALSPDGRVLWVAYEEGTRRWGKDLGSEWRTAGGGLQYDRRLILAKVEPASGKSEPVADAALLVPSFLAEPKAPNSPSVCLPALAVDREGNPWLFFRCGKAYWQTVVTKYDASANAFTAPQPLAQSNHSQDRRVALALDPQGSICASWAGDGRKSNDSGDSGVYAVRIDPAAARPLASPLVGAVAVARADESLPQPVNKTPERARDARHQWSISGAQYTLYWGDFHRHTDFSNCRACDDGCIVEAFRYAYDAAGLDFMATTDHSDQGPNGYAPYEWWQSQKLADVFENPAFFITFYAYEREQRGPYGHRNVIFTERGGPIVNIGRKLYAQSPWARQIPLPPEAGVHKGEITPWQLWDMLRQSGVRVTAIPHTPAGDDWSALPNTGGDVESLMEIYQGSRMSYESAGAPQPAVATSKEAKDTGAAPDDGAADDVAKARRKSRRGAEKPDAASAGAGEAPAKARGFFQNALAQGRKLGVFASSDHRSTNISFGGVYVKSFDRAGIFDAIQARRTVAATDKIFMQLSCNGHLLGEVCEIQGAPVLQIDVRGTAPLKSVMLIRNEKICYAATPSGPDFTMEYKDNDPAPGENRYYVRVEQVDGNMGWTSPIWATMR